MADVKGINPITAETSSDSNTPNDKVWLYEENIKRLYSLDDNPERKAFLDDFFSYRRKNGLYCKIPVIARKPLDVFVLYYIVQKYGGFEQTMKNRMWSQIARELDLPRTMTSGAFTLKLKYIRLLYQFECYKCNKAVNHAILYNESALIDPKERYDSQSDDRRPPTMRSHPIPVESYVKTDYVENKEKEYRDALITRLRSSSEEYEYASYPVQRGKYRHYEHSPKSLPSRSPDTMCAITESSRHASRYPYYTQARPNSYKRKYSTEEYYEEPNDHEFHPRKVSRRPSVTAIDLQQMSVSFMEITNNRLTLKVSLNNERYEGVLKCC